MLTQVKSITKDTANGTSSKKALSDAIASLEIQSDKVKILTQESKILGEWTFGEASV